jgi:hypothetical protein
MDGVGTTERKKWNGTNRRESERPDSMNLIKKK